MNEVRKTALLLVALAAVYAYMAAYEDHEIDDLAGPARLLRLDPAWFREVHLDAGRGAPAVKLTRGGEPDPDHPASGWRIRVGDKDLPADEAAVRPLLEKLGGFPVERVVDDGGADPKNFGLDEPTGRVRWAAGVAAPAGDRQGELLLGGKSPVGSLRFVQRRGDPRVYAAKSFTVAAMRRGAEHFRSKRVLPVLAEEELSTIHVAAGEESFKARRRPDGAWSAVEPRSFPLDAAALRAALEELNGARVREFLGEASPAALAENGLAPPAATATFTAAEGQVARLAIGAPWAKAPTRRAVHPTPGDQLFTVDGERLAGLLGGAAPLRETRLVGSRVGDLQKLTVRRNGPAPREETYAKLGGPWKAMSAPERGLEAEIAAVREGATSLAADRILTAPADLAAYGLDPPTYEVTFEGGGRAATLRVSGPGVEGGPYAQLAGEPDVAAASAAAWCLAIEALLAATPGGAPAP